MKLLDISDAGAVVRLNEPELLATVGALNDLWGGVALSDTEFEARVGMAKAPFEKTLDALVAIYRRLPQPPPGAPVE